MNIKVQSYLPDIKEYSDYRLFLKTFYENIKSVHGGYSYRSLAEALGFEASNFLHLLIHHKRNLSPEGGRKITGRLGLKGVEKKYFLKLVTLNQSSEKAEQEKIREELSQILNSKARVLEDVEYNYFQHWYIPVIREMMGLYHFVPNLNWISKKIQPTVSEEEILEAFKVLENLQLVERRQGKWMPVEKHLATPPEVTSDSLYQYHHQMLKLSLLALKLEAPTRDLSALTMSLSETQFQWLKERLVSFREEIQQTLSESDEPATKVVQLNMQLFPVVKDET